jgi:8-oxo-dGTP diphosphatase
LTGGHLEVEEHPIDAVKREIREELNIEAKFLIDHPLFLTVTVTVGLTSGHRDVSLWCISFQYTSKLN